MGGDEMDLDMEIDAVSQIIRNFLHVNVEICKDCRQKLE